MDSEKKNLTYEELQELPLSALKLDLWNASETKGCAKLLRVLQEKGATTVEDLRGACVSLEAFFDGNYSKSNIAANVQPAEPYDTIEAWYDHLKQVRAHESVHDVLVSINMIEPYGDASLKFWPYSDVLWIYASIDQSQVAELLKPLQPTRVVISSDPDLSNHDPPFPAPDGFETFWAWWD